MDEIRQYILSVLCVVVICGLFQTVFVGIENTAIRFVAGVMITIVAITPVLRGEISLEYPWDGVVANSQEAVSDGELSSQEALAAHIKERTEAYILDKAKELGADIKVNVELDGDSLPTPSIVTLTGVVSPYTKRQLIDSIHRELAMSEDQQRWIS